MQRAPDFEAPALRGGAAIRLSAYRGRVVYVDFWAPWCASCQISMPELKRLEAQFAGRPFAVVSVDADPVLKTGLAFLDRVGADYPVAWDKDGEVQRRFEVSGLPTGVLIDASGLVRIRILGWRPDQGATLRANIEQLLSEQALGIVREPRP